MPASRSPQDHPAAGHHPHLPDQPTPPSQPAARASATARATPLSRDQRRAAIIDATLPLLHQHGQSVTTRQIAEAGGVAEGTIFRAFPDKAALIDACLAAALDPQPALRRFADIDRAMPLEPRLAAAVHILQDHLRTAVGLMLALGIGGPAEPRESATRPAFRGGDGHQELLDAFAELLEPDRDRLRTSPAETANLARVLTFAASHPRITDGRPMTAEQIVSLLLYGVLAHDCRPRCGGAAC